MSFIAVLPARMHSTRLPNKPLADIHGKPMIVRVCERVAASRASALIVATDHPEIAAAVKTAGFDVCMTSPECASGTDRLAEVARQRQLADDAILVNVQGDEPLIDPDLVNQVAEHLADHPELALATAAHALHSLEDMQNPNVVKVVLNAAHEALYFSRAPIPWPRDAWMNGATTLPEGLPVYRHIGLYAYRRSFLADFASWPVAPLEQFEALEQLRALWHGRRIGVVLSQTIPAAGVDTPEDLARVRHHFLISSQG